MKVFFCTFLIYMLFSVPAISQEKPDASIPQGENFDVPEGWNVRLDNPDTEVVIGSDPDTSDIYFVNMTPGWHITTGPAGIFYHPANTANGDYTLKTIIHLFDPGERHHEAYGLFFGGNNLDADLQEYLYFLLRNTGEYLIKSRKGVNTELIKDWTASDAIVNYENKDSSSVKNELTVAVSGEDMHFLINGEEVALIGSGDFETDGIFGLRINHSINVHIADLKVSE